MSTIAKFLAQPPNGFSTQIASATLAANALSVSLDSTSGLPTEGVGQFFKKDANGDLVAGSVEFVHWTNISGNTMTFSDTDDRGITGSDSGAQAYVADDYFEVWDSSYYVGGVGGLIEHTADGTHGDITPTSIDTPALQLSTSSVTADNILDEDTMSSDSATALATQQSIKAYVDSAVSGVSTDGWTSSGDTWTYASASTFTIAGVDRTAVFTKGTRLKFTQTTAKYAVVVSSSFSTNTTVTIAVNTDYTIANAAITSPYYSYQASPAGYPGWFAFTPTLGGFSAAFTVGVCRYSIDGNTCRFVLTNSNDGTSDATTKTFTVPVAPARTMQVAALGGGKDNGSLLSAPVQVETTAASATVAVYKGLYNATWTASGNSNFSIGNFAFEF